MIDRYYWHYFDNLLGNMEKVLFVKYGLEVPERIEEYVRRKFRALPPQMYRL